MENNNININNNDVVNNESLFQTIINNEPKTGTYSELTEQINGFLGFKFEKIERDLENENK